MGNLAKYIVVLVIVLFVTSLVIYQPVTVKADSNQSKTIIVPDQYSTIEQAIKNATDGDTINVKNGIYQENAMNITKSISIIGEGSQSTTLNMIAPSFNGQMYGINLTTYGKAITVNANNFTLSGFTINTNGGDISISGNNIEVTNNQISAPFSAVGYNFNITNNTFLKGYFESGWGVNFNYPFTISTSLSQFCYNTISYDRSNCPVTFDGKYDVITNNKISGCVVYIDTAPCFFSGNTISNSLDWVSIVASNSVMTKNTINSIDHGFGNEGSNNIIFANLITNCGKAFSDSSEHYYSQATFPGNQSGVFYGNNFINNYRNLDCSQMNKIDAFDNGTIGNYWSNYKAVDSNGDGIGDTPYNLDSDRTDFYPLMAAFDISSAPDLMPKWAQNLNALALAKADNGSTIPLILGGNITFLQMSNIQMTTNLTIATTVLSFNVTGLSDSVGFSNISIPISEVPFGTVPSIQVDGESVSNQAYTQDSDYFYVWYTIHFSTHEVSITFQKSNQTYDTTIFSIALFGVIIVFILLISILLIRRHRKTAKT
jgi:hypothetical protein